MEQRFSNHKLNHRLVMAAEWYKGGGDISIFIGFSLVLSMFLGQDRIVSRADISYWLLIVPALVFPALRLRQTVESLIWGIARPLGIFGALGGIWFMARGDYSVVPPLILIAWVSGWALRLEAKTNLNLLLAIFLTFYALGVVRYYTQPPLDGIAWLTSEFSGEPAAFVDPDSPAVQVGVSGAEADVTTAQAGAPAAQADADDNTGVDPDQFREGLDLNGWGVLPGQTAPTYGPWRISATPNIATSGTVSFFALILALSPFAMLPLRLITISASGYFLFLSFVRSTLVAFCLFLLTQLSLRLFRKHKRLALIIAVLLVSGSILFTAVAPYLLYALQDIGIVSRLFLRGQSGLSLSDIARQVYRPWLWGQHLQLFLVSDFWMGHGSDLAASATQTIINEGHSRSDSVSLPTRLLAAYGLPSLAFFWFIAASSYRHIRNNDVWAVSAVSAIIWLMMTWGSVFHPTNALFVLAILVLGRGSDAFALVRRSKV